MVKQTKDRLIGIVILAVLSIMIISLMSLNMKRGWDIELVVDQRDQLVRENEHFRYIHQLAIEFGLDPKIVMTVDNLAGEYWQPDEMHYRLLNRELYTYMFLSLIWAESKGDPQAIGDNGKAFGLTQMWLSTAQQYYDDEVSKADLLSVQFNLNASFEHADYLLTKYHGNVALWLYSWNRGEGTVDELMRYGGALENGYAARVYLAAELNNRRQLWR